MTTSARTASAKNELGPKILVALAQLRMCANLVLATRVASDSVRLVIHQTCQY